MQDLYQSGPPSSSLPDLPWEVCRLPCLTWTLPIDKDTLSHPSLA